MCVIEQKYHLKHLFGIVFVGTCILCAQLVVKAVLCRCVCVGSSLLVLVCSVVSCS